MRFDESRPIYLQIAEHFCDKIMNEDWPPGERVPSVREIAALIEVNPNTAMRAFHLLLESNILVQQRGVGYFTTSTAKSKVVEMRKEQFLNEELPELFSKMKQLGFTPEDLQKKYQKWEEQN
ncbi:MAG: GntR family transcriptional regulator [Balneolia bacterium]|nr:GntR family transcriptional regulator [Balneolia bacterium]